MTRIVFSSCSRIEAFPSQPQWKTIEAMNPDHLLLLGDNIYMDYWDGEYWYQPGYLKTTDPKHLKNISNDEFYSIMDSKYKEQWNESHFKSLRDNISKKGGHTFGTWDDHDFAWDNAVGDTIPEQKKNISNKLFNKWFYNNNNTDKIYKWFDTDFARVIILDQCTYSSKYELIGVEQLDFLKNALCHDKNLTLICGSKAMTLSPTFSGISLAWLTKTNKWNNYINEYQKVSNILSEHSSTVLYLAGDLHQNLFSKPTKKRPCYEIISSGMAVDNFASQSTKRREKNNQKNPNYNPRDAYDALSNWSVIDIEKTKVSITQSSKRSTHARKDTKHTINLR